MAGNIITSELRLTGTDAGAAEMLAKVAAQLKKVDEAAAHSAEVTKLGKEMAALQKEMDSVAKMTAAEKTLTAMQERETATAAAAAKLRAELAAVDAPTNAMTKAMERAEAANVKAASAVLRQAESIERQRKALVEMGLSANNAAHEQDRLARSFVDVARAAEAQLRVDQQVAEANRRGAIAARERQRAEEDRRHAIAHHGIGNAVVQGVAGAVAVHSVLTPIEHAVHLGIEHQHEVVAIQNAQQDALKKDPGLMKAIEDAAKRATVAVPTSTYIDNLKVLNETTGAFGNVHHAMENLEFMQKTASVLKAAAGDKIHGSPGDMAAKFAKVFEMRGTAFESGKFQDEAGQMVQAMAFSGGKFNPDEMLNFAQQAGRATLKGYDMDFLARIAPTLVGDSSGEKVGTQAKMFRKLIMGTVSDKQQAQEWVRLGLIDPKMVNMKAGHAVSWKAGAVKGSDLAMTNPLAWFETVALPAMKAHGVDTETATKLSTELALFVRKGTANDFAESLAQESSRHQLHSDFANIKGAGTLDDQYHRNLKADPTVAMTALSAAFDNLLTAVTSDAMIPAAKGITAVAEALQGLAAAAKDHPMAAMATGGAVAAGGLAASGWAAYSIVNGFGLPAASAHLETSAIALDAVAGKIGAGSVAGGAGGAVNAAENAAGGAAGSLGMFGRFLAMGSIAGAGVFVGDAMLNRRDSSKALVDGGRPDPLTVNDNNSMLPGMDSGTLSDNAEAVKRAADAARDAGTAAVGAWDWIKSTAKGFGFGDRLPVEVPSAVPLPPERPSGYTGRGEDGNALHNNRTDEIPAAALTRALAPIVPPPEVVEGFRLLPPAAHGAADALDRMKDREDQLKDSFGLTGFTLGALDKQTGVLQASFTTLDTGSDSASQQLALLALAARTVSGSLAGMLAAGGGGGGGNGVISASYEEGGGQGFNSFPTVGRSGVGGGGRRGGGGSGGGYSGGGSGAFKGGAAPGKQSLMAKEAYDFWRSKGLDHAHAIGMVVQEQAENNFGNTPGDYVNGRPTAFGPFQFHKNRADLIKAGTGIDVMNPNLSHADALRAAYFDATKGGRAGYLDRYMRQASGIDGSSDYATRFYEGPKYLGKDQAIRRHMAHAWNDRGFPGAEVAAAAGVPALPKGGYWAKDSKGNPVAVGANGAAIPSLNPRRLDEHPALAGPSLKPRTAPAEHERPARITEAKLEEVATAVRDLHRTVERGGLHRVEIKAHRSLTATKTYSRGSMGVTTA